MPSWGHLATFALASVVLIVVPGPSVLFTVSRALTIGRRGAALTVAGNAAGEYVLAIAVAFGLGTLVQHSVVAFTMLKLVGAVYLVYLGVQAVRNRRSLAETVTSRLSPARDRRVFADGFLVGVANPKSLVFFGAVLPQFVERTAGSVTAQMLVLGTLFTVIALFCDSLWAVGAGTARAWFARSPQRLATLGGAGGLAMIGLGATLALSGRKD